MRLPLHCARGLDPVTNTSAARRLKWTRACHVDQTTLYIDPPEGGNHNDIASSSVPMDDDEYFWMLNRRAYQPRAKFQQKSWPIMFLDDMIDHGMRLKANSEQAEPSSGSGSIRGDRGGRGRGRGGQFTLAVRGGSRGGNRGSSRGGHRGNRGRGGLNP